jgi:two-component system OmpR family response regulator
MDRLQIILIDDDDNYRLSLSSYLKKNGCNVIMIKTLGEDFDPIHNLESTIYLVNLGTNTDMAAEFFSNTERRYPGPILVLLDDDDRTDRIDRIVFFELGADDCILKTAHKREILARIRIAHRLAQRAREAIGTRQTAGQADLVADWQVLPETHEVIAPGGGRIHLTPQQFRLFDILMRHADLAISREYISREMFDGSSKANDRRIDTLIARLRRRLDESGQAPGIIKTVRGGGYVFDGSTGMAARHRSDR